MENNPLKDNKSNQKAEKIPNKEDKVTLSKNDYDDIFKKSEERDAFYDKFLRMQADFDNAKRRFEKEKTDALKYANENFVFDLLPILDSLEIAEGYIKEAKDFKAVQEGVGMIQGQIQKFLKDIGLEKIDVSNAKFDPHIHEAVETVEDSDKEDGSIVGELKPGYKFNGKLLRPVLVKVVKKNSEDKK